MASEWKVLAKARNDLADMLDGLSEEQLAAQSLCEEWTVTDVAGHLVSLIEMSKIAMITGIVKHRKDVDGYLSVKAKEFAANGAPALIQSLRVNAGKQLKPLSEGSMVADTAVHALDIIRPLGLADALNPEVLTVALDAGTSELAKKLKGKPMPRLVATDIDWSWGEGPEVRGTGEALLLALNQRDVAAELEGDGAALLG